MTPTPLQLEEDLEQLKVLKNGYNMKVLNCGFLTYIDMKGNMIRLLIYIFFAWSQVIKVDHDAHGVDTPEDVAKIENFMRERNLS